MNNGLKKCLLIALLLPLTACAHYYPHQYGYASNSGRFGGGDGGWQRNYYGNPHNQHYYNYPAPRPYGYSVQPRWSHEGYAARDRHEGWGNRFGNNQRLDRYPDRQDRNSWHRDRDNRSDDHEDHHGWRENRSRHHRDHDDD
jgi:hypothetical protein